MRIAVAGATGHIGALAAAALERGGHDVVRISRSLGVDLLTGDGLDGARANVEAVVDTTNATATDPDAVVHISAPPPATCSPPNSRPGCATTCCCRSSASTGSRATPTTPASANRSASSKPGGCPGPSFQPPSSTTSQRWSRAGPSRTASPTSLRCSSSRSLRPTSPRCSPRSPPASHRGATRMSPAPRRRDLVDVARRINEVFGRKVHLVPTWSGVFGTSMAGNVLLPGEGARLMSTTFDEWLEAGAAP